MPQKNYHKKMNGEVQRLVQNISIKSRRVAEQLAAGGQRTKFKSKGSSFAEVRRYDHTDDARNIHWNITARLRAPYVKVFEEERERTIVVLIDISASQHIGAHLKTKQQVSAEVAAILGFAATKGGDKLCALFFSDGIIDFLPPQKNTMQPQKIIHKTLSLQPKPAATRLSPALDYINRIFKKSCVVFIISDFIIDENYAEILKKSAFKHELIGIHLYDEYETKLPQIGIAAIKNTETGAQSYIDTQDMEAQRIYAQVFEQRKDVFIQNFKKINARYVSLPTHRSFVPELLAFFR